MQGNGNPNALAFNKRQAENNAQNENAHKTKAGKRADKLPGCYPNGEVN